MADSKITALTALTTADPANDMMPIVDVSDTSMAASGTTKRISINNILACSPSATLASATITGDLTVDTSTLKVDSANDRVGVGLATPGYKLHVQGSAGLQLVLQTNNTDATAKEGTVSSRHYTNAEEPVSVVGSYATSTNNYLYVGGGFSGGNAATSIGFYTAANSTTVTGTERYSIASDGVATWSNVGGVAGTAMTLNSTGLGVGVTPSATDSTYYQALEIGRVGQGFTGAKSVLTGSPNSWFSNNSYATYSAGIVWKYAVSQPAAQYRLVDASHQWLIAASGTAGNAITFTQAMTLSAAGSLVLGAAAVATTATDGFLYIPGCAGTPTGTPTSQTGRVPLVVDTTNNKLYFYSGGSWVAAN
jgi:hypothetical protein